VTSVPPAVTVGVPSQTLVVLSAQTGKPPARKSFSTALVDCEERVSTRKLLKQGSCVTPTDAKAAVRLTFEE
jgi:hypothetical protein